MFCLRFSCPPIHQECAAGEHATKASPCRHSPYAGDLKLSLPSRLGIGTVKAAAWQVLAEAGPEGMPVYDIAREIQKRGFRDLRSSKTPESSGGCQGQCQLQLACVGREQLACNDGKGWPVRGGLNLVGGWNELKC